MIKLIISDMDGTLLNSQHELSRDFMYVFEQLEQRGIYFCAASGRQYLSLLQFFAPVKDRMAFISENGAFVNVNGKEVYQNAIAPYHIQLALERSKSFSGMAIGLCGKKAKVTISGAYWIDITNAGVNKGVAVEALQASLGITPDETMAFGDYLNDLEMLTRATYSYAMKNAQEEVKQVAAYQTEEDNNNDGVLKTIVKELKIPFIS